MNYTLIKSASVLTMIVLSGFACNKAKFQAESQAGKQPDRPVNVGEMNDKSTEDNKSTNGNSNAQPPIVHWPEDARGPQDPGAQPRPGGPDLLGPKPNQGPTGAPIGPVAVPPGTPANSPQNPNNPGAPVANPNDPRSYGNECGFGGSCGAPERYSRKVDLGTTCLNTQPDGVNYIDFSAARRERIEANITGQFCPQRQNALNILFVVDFSASMGKHQPEDGGPVQEGNDPLVNGSCGRLQAASAIIDKVKANAKPTDQVRIAMIPFAGAVVRNFIVRGVDLATFQQKLNNEQFCRYVLQGEEYRTPGALSQREIVGGANSSTNYAAAFQETIVAMSRNLGRNVIYFITDGEPTSPKPDPIGRANVMAAQIRREVPNLVFNGIILGSKRANAEQVLNNVTGSPDRVRYAAQASDLSAEITKFPDARLDVNHPANTAWVFVDPYQPKQLGLLSFTESAPVVYTYKTQPVVLLGMPGRVILNRVVVEARGSDGSTHRSIVVVRYRQD